MAYIKSIDYKFKNELLFKEAVTHRSYKVENNLNYDNQRLELLGDAVIQLVTTNYLFKHFKNKPEGDLTIIRAGLVKKETLAGLAEKISLDKLLLLGKGEEANKGRKSKSILCDAFEAMIGAIYLDSDISVIENKILPLFVTLANNTIIDSLSQNPKGDLQHILQSKFNITPTYKLLKESGQEHNKLFTVAVFKNELKLAEGSGSNIKKAEKEAASNALKKL